MMCDTVTMQPQASARPASASVEPPGEETLSPADDRHALTVKPDCPLCAAPNSARMDGSCHGCRARDIAQSQAAWRALRGITDVEIRDAILATYGRDGYKAGREAVWGWIKRLGLDGGAPDAQRGAR